VGGLKSTNKDYLRLDPVDVVTTIKWLIESKVEIPYLYIDNTSEELKKYWLAKK
jgi:hypothetical protein